MTEQRKVVITYSYGTDAEDNGAGASIAEEIASRLPLRNLAWQNPLRISRGNTSAPRVISVLQADLKRYSPDMFPRAMPGTLYHSSYFLHLYLVTTDDNELYKTVIRKQIQDWLNVVANKKNQEWLIVYVSSPESRGKSARFLGVGASVFDRIKSDFNFKKERCVRVKLYNDVSKDAESWTELQNHMKDGIVNSLNQQILQYDEDTRRFDQQRLMPGWNYCQYFIMKEGLAYTFELMNLFDEALIQYDELEASFFQTLAEQGAPWFAKFGGTEPEDDSGDILNIKRKPYRDMIMQNTISIFDFRMYLFARQCQLLFRMGYAVDICQRAKVFITQFARTIQEHQVSLISCFRESWIYSACMNVIGHCEELVAVSTLPPEVLTFYEGAKADLLQYARMQLDSLGLASNIFPYSIHANLRGLQTTNLELMNRDGAVPDVQVETKAVADITNSELKEAMSSIAAFDDLYLVRYNVRLRELKKY
ncbi:hypothetical protein SpCBS45565_g02844 [Spizellomyces sp. 'palustris']|nr:hypothetical protein SpCBS45565_g02844 [Spizellomyces sp. 'palustris']